MYRIYKNLCERHTWIYINIFCQLSDLSSRGHSEVLSGPDVVRRPPIEYAFLKGIEYPVQLIQHTK